MILRRNDMEKETKLEMRGGKGACVLTYLGGKNLQRHCRVFSEIEIPAGSSIGEHEHSAETEYYLILEGKGLVDDDGALKEVSPGDVVVTTGGAKHSIEAAGDSSLKLVAVIVTDA